MNFDQKKDGPNAKKTADGDIRDFVDPEFAHLEKKEPLKENTEEKVERGDSFIQRAKKCLSTPEIRNQFVKALAKGLTGAGASMIGIKALFDVPEYLRERWQVRGIFGKGKGLTGSVEDLLEASWKKSKSNISGEGEGKYTNGDSEDRKKRQEQRAVLAEEREGGINNNDIRDYVDPERAHLEEKMDVRDSIRDLNERLKLTKEGTQKKSEQRNKIAQLLRNNRKIKADGIEGEILAAEESGNETAVKVASEYEQKREINLEQTRAKMADILDNYTTTKVTGMQASKEALNTALVLSSSFGLRPIGYGLLDAVGRYQRLTREANIYKGLSEEEKQEVATAESPTWKNMIIGPITETFDKLRFKGSEGKEENGIQKAMGAAKALSNVVRYMGFGATMAFHPDNVMKSMDSLCDMLEGHQTLSAVGNNFGEHLEKVTHVSCFTKHENMGAGRVSFPKSNSLGINHDNAIFGKVNAPVDSGLINHDDVIFHENPAAGINHDNAIFHENPAVGINHGNAIFGGASSESAQTTESHSAANHAGNEIHHRAHNTENHPSHGVVARQSEDPNHAHDFRSHNPAEHISEDPIVKTQEHEFDAKPPIEPYVEKAPADFDSHKQYQEHLSHVKELEAQKAEVLNNIHRLDNEQEPPLNSPEHPAGDESALREQLIKHAQLDKEIQDEKNILAGLVSNDSPAVDLHGSPVADSISTQSHPENIPANLDIHEKVVTPDIKEVPGNNVVAHDAQPAHLETPEAVHVATENVPAGHLDHETHLKSGDVKFEYDSKGEITGYEIKNSGVIVPKNYMLADAGARTNKAFDEGLSHIQNRAAIGIINSSLNADINARLPIYDELLATGHPKEAHVVLTEIYNSIDRDEKNIGIDVFDRSKLPSLDGHNMAAEHLQSIPSGAHEAPLQAHVENVPTPNGAHKAIEIAPRETPASQLEQSTEHIDRMTGLGLHGSLGRVKFEYDNGEIIKSDIRLPAFYTVKAGETFLISNSKELIHRAPLSGYESGAPNVEYLANKNNDIMNNQVIRYMHMYEHLNQHHHGKEARAVLKKMWEEINFTEKRDGVQIFDRSKLPMLDRN